MGDYIRRSAVLAKAYWHGDSYTQSNPYPDGVEAVDVSAIEQIPAADVVEVVRCKDCRYYPIEGIGRFDLKWPIDGYNCPFCVGDEYYSAKPEKDGYCSMGKRRELND